MLLQLYILYSEPLEDFSYVRVASIISGIGVIAVTMTCEFPGLLLGDLSSAIEASS